MFKVLRSLKPENWTNTNYKDPLVVKQLKRDFFSKCYICELKDFGNVNVEHFVPHLNQDINLMIEWTNLYYACSHCNGIKGARHKELLDCCNIEHNVDANIGLYAPTVPNGKVIIENLSTPNSPHYELTNKTIELLEQCYNNSNNGTQQVSHVYLVQQIHKKYSHLWQIRFDLLLNKDRLSAREFNELIEKITNMLKPNYPFSAFWRTFIKNDSQLLEILEENNIFIS